MTGIAPKDGRDAADGPVEFLRGTIHDINVFLGVILGRLQILQRSVREPDLARQLVLLETAARDAAAIAGRAWLQEPGWLPGRCAVVELAPLVEDCLELLRPRREDTAGDRDSHVAVTVAVPPDVLVQASPVVLREVLVNVIVNALEAMPAGGSLHLSARGTGPQVQLLVADSGCGIDGPALDNLFGPQSRSSKRHGHGLGLKTCRSLLEAMGGSIEIQSGVGKGTSVEILLPAGSDSPPTSPPAAPLAAGQARQRELAGSADAALAGMPTPARRVLVVDDEPQIRSLLTEVLTGEGHRVVTAADGQSALGLFRKAAFDVVILDLVMPGTSGLDLAGAIRRQDAEVAIVLLTGWGEERTGQEAAGGVIDLLAVKPLDITSIGELIQQGAAITDGRKRDSRSAHA